MRCGISERLQVISFNRVAMDELQESIHKIRQQNPTWGSFEEALREAYDYERPKEQDRREFDEWVTSENTHQSATQAFLEFEHRFARLLERERLVGEDKLLMFVRSIDRKERMDIGIKLEDDDGANGLTEDWAKVERVCGRHDGKLTTEPDSRETKDEMEVASQRLRTNDMVLRNEEERLRCSGYSVCVHVLQDRERELEDKVIYYQLNNTSYKELV